MISLIHIKFNRYCSFKFLWRHSWARNTCGPKIFGN